MPNPDLFEYIEPNADHVQQRDIRQFVEMELLGARLQANSAISLALPHELPALELP